MFRHIVHQTRSIGASAGLLFAKKGAGSPELPGPVVTETVAPRPPALVADYLRVVGGDRKAWKGRVPPHMFPQWCWPALTRTLTGLPYDLTKVVNAGCTWECRGPLPLDEALSVQAQLVEIDDDGRRALVHVDMKTGTPQDLEALTARMTIFIPLPRKKDPADADKPREKRKRDEPLVPADAVEVGSKKLAANHGWRFALVTGDFNPIHWVGPAGKAAGFGGVIMHGFGTAAVAAEQLIQNRFAGDVDGLHGMSMRFTRPLRLPGTPRIFVDPDAAEGAPNLWVGTAPGGPAFLVGGFHG